MSDKKNGPPGGNRRADEVERIEQAPHNIQSADDQGLGLEIPTFLKRGKLKVHPAAAKFPMMPRDELLELGKSLLTNGLQTPIALFCHCDPDTPEASEPANWSLLDGRNRFAALEAVGLSINVRAGRNSPVITVSGSADLEKWDEFVDREIILQYRGDLWAWIDILSDPYAYVLSANVHRRHLKPEDKRTVILALLEADPTKSNRQVGKEVGASHHTVDAVRQEAEARGQVAHVDKRRDSKGRSQPAAKPKPAQLSPRQVKEKITREPTVYAGKPDLKVVKSEPEPEALDAEAYKRLVAAWREAPDFQSGWRAANSETRQRFVGWLLAGAADA